MANIYHALDAKVRRLILDELLLNDGQSLFEIGNRLIMKHGLSITRQAISQHLDVLEETNLISTKRDGRYKFHYVNLEPLKEITNRWLKNSKGD